MNSVARVRNKFLKMLALLNSSSDHESLPCRFFLKAIYSFHSKKNEFKEVLINTNPELHLFEAEVISRSRAEAEYQSTSSQDLVMSFSNLILARQFNFQPKTTKLAFIFLLNNIILF